MSGFVRRSLGRLRPPPGIGREALAAVPGAIASVPDGMASAVLAGVNPIHGLYASTFGPIAGGLSASTQRMVVTTTTASALAAGSAIAAFDSKDRPAALFLVAILSGVAMIAAGIGKLGRYTRFVSHSVMIGFLSGVAVNIIFGQLADLTGTEDVQGKTSLAKGIWVIVHPGRWDLPSLACGLVALAILFGLGRTRVASISALIALLVPTVACILLGATSVATVSDNGAIPSGFPLPALPHLRLLNFDLLIGVAAVTAVVLVQGAGVAEAAPNLDGRSTDVNQDFVAQGAGNVTSGLFGGMTVGASIGQTAVNTTAGAKTRWAAILSGVWMLLIILLFAEVVGHVVSPTLGAVLVFAAIGAIRPGEALTIARTGTISRIAITATFVATLLVPVAAAVGLGVVISLLLQVNREALDLAVVELRVEPDGIFTEHPAPAVLAPHRVTMLDVYGSLFYAGAKTLEVRLPAVPASGGAVVVLRLRGRTVLGATSFLVLERYAQQLADADGRLYLSGVDPTLVQQFSRAGRPALHEAVHLYEATSAIGRSSRDAFAEAEAWLTSHPADRPEGDDLGSGDDTTG